MGMMGTQQGMGKGIGGYSANGLGGPTYEIDEKVYKLERYAELSGDTIQRIVLEEGEPCTDLKIIMLKASNVGELVKDVGMKLSEHKFAVYREKGEIYV